MKYYGRSRVDAQLLTLPVQKTCTTLMLNDFALLVSKNTREGDDYVNATVWAKAFGKEWKHYKESQRCKRISKVLAKDLKVGIPRLLESGRGRASQSYVHPAIAIDFAEWLSPEFSLFVKQIFLKYLKGDADLGADMIIRDHNKERQQKALKRVKVTLSNKDINDLSQKHGLPYHKLHDDRNVGLYGKTTKQLRVDGDVEKETPLNYLSDLDISYADAANGMVIAANNPALMALAASGIADLHKKITGKTLEPTWDIERLTPAKARKITHSTVYQTELPLSTD